ncbi:MAG: response regulator transcription factor [Verrucomicrobiota bacterium]|jgi:two-component system NarL family response regulator
MGTKQIRIAMVEDEVLMGKVLQAWLSREADFVFVGLAADSAAGWTLCQAARPDLVLMDIELNGEDGLALVRRLLAALPKTRILFISGLLDPATVWEVLQSGGHGYVEKSEDPAVLVAAIRTVAGGGFYYSPAFQAVRAERLSRPDAFHKVLSEREREVLRRVASGWDDARTAASLGIASGTVEAHRKHMRQKLGVHSDRELIYYAQCWGLDRRRAANGFGA